MFRTSFSALPLLAGKQEGYLLAMSLTKEGYMA